MTIDHRTMNLCFVWCCQAMLLPMRHARMMFIPTEEKRHCTVLHNIIYNIHTQYIHLIIYLYIHSVYTLLYIYRICIYIYICFFNNVDFGILVASSALVEALSRSPGGAGARERRRIASQTHQCRGHGCS